MNTNIHIFIFIDALGWEVIKRRSFLEDLLPYRYPTAMQFGYSSTAIPTILTGQPPTVHKHLSFYYYAPHLSPFGILRLLMLEYLPSRVVDRWRVRHILSKLVARWYGYTGYFEMYAMPFSRLRYFDYIEKTDIFVPGGLAPVKNIADELTERGIPYHISNWRKSEIENVEALISDIRQENIGFAFLYTAAMDAMLHMETKDGLCIPEKIAWYDRQIRRVVNEAREHYENFTIHVMSDHGMTTLVGVIDLKKTVESSGLKFGVDYAAVYDSTMGRFWFFNDRARTVITELLARVEHAHLLSEEELQRYRVDFPDHMYGELFLLLDPGWQIAPSDMGLKPLPGMHGYAPEHPDSMACFLSSEPLAEPPQQVADYHRVMLDCMERLKNG